jgi:sulfide:quinone oxidoreductase
MPQRHSDLARISSQRGSATIDGVNERKKVLIAGAGVAGLEAALALRELADDRVSVELFSPDSDFVYRPLSVAAAFHAGEAHRFPLVRLAEEAGADLTKAALRSVDLGSKVVQTSNGELAYDVLLLALGARPVAGVEGAITFRGPGDEETLGDVLRDAREGRIRELAFTMPAGISWPLPMYELALLTTVHLADAGADVRLEIVTPEQRPLQLFGAQASDVVAGLLDEHGIRVWADKVPLAAENGVLRFVGSGQVEADRVVALPLIEGPRIPGVPHDTNGFVPSDEHGRVRGVEHVFAAGDLTDFPVKQGGLAAQQADAAAEAIAAEAGADVVPRPFAPVLRGLMLTGLTPRFMQTELGRLESVVDTEPLWWPPGKIAGRYLGPFLAERLHLSQTAP